MTSIALAIDTAIGLLIGWLARDLRAGAEQEELERRLWLAAMRAISKEQGSLAADADDGWPG